MTQPVKLRDVLNKIGFEEMWGTMTDQEPAYRYDFGNLQLTATQVMSMRFRPIFLFGGVWGDGRMFSEVDFEMPLEVASFEQGVAWIVYGIGQGFKPHNPCSWFDQGWEWQDSLPWVQRMKAFKLRPQCAVDREWFKVAVKKLRGLAAIANETDMAIFWFDGEVLRINACDQTIVMPADGIAWSEKYAIKAQTLDFLPKRLMTTIISFSVWDGHLSIGKRSWTLVSNTNSGSMGSKKI